MTTGGASRDVDNVGVDHGAIAFVIELRSSCSNVSAEGGCRHAGWSRVFTQPPDNKVHTASLPTAGRCARVRSDSGHAPPHPACAGDDRRSGRSGRLRTQAILPPDAHRLAPDRVFDLQVPNARSGTV